MAAFVGHHTQPSVRLITTSSPSFLLNRFIDGRRRIYLLSLPLACVGAIGVFFSKTIVHLFISRAIQALGASSLMSQGAATISDIYRVEERGAAMGVYFGVRVSS